MERYLLFSGDHYDTGGGWDNFDGSYVDLDTAMGCARARIVYERLGWAHIVDMQTGEIVYRYSPQGAS